METQKQETSIDVYSIVTNRIIELLEQGTVPWQKPWTTAGIPRNLLSKRPYQGINILLLNSLSYEHNLFLTWKQIKTIGASVKKGEKGHLIVFNKMVEKEEHGEKKKKFFLRYYKVFNISSCADIPIEFLPKEGATFEKIATCDAVVDDMQLRPSITSGGNQAYYDPQKDIVNMPPIKKFKGAEKYYSVLFHELVHSTGHESRLHRKEVTGKIIFGSEDYSLEELTAEIGACYLKSYTGIVIDHFEQSAAYISNWLEVLKHDKRFIIQASTRAQKAVDFILNKKEEEQHEISDENTPKADEVETF